MNSVAIKALNALRHAVCRFAAFGLAVLFGVFCATNAHAQIGATDQTRPHGQVGMHPPTKPATAPPRVPVSTQVEAPKTTPAGEQFFMIASLDQSKSEILLKRPDEVTLLVNATPKTQYIDENGRPLKLSDIRAGDAVWVIASGGAQPAAIRIRKGQMTVAELHRYYLDYPEIK
jgi:hypothetical protein